MEIETTIYVEPNTPKLLAWLPECVLGFIIPQEIELDVTIDVDFEWTNDGIGEYQFWGHRCYDHGTNYVEVNGVNSFDFDKADLPWFFRHFFKDELRHRIAAACEDEAQEDYVREKCEEYDDCPY